MFANFTQGTPECPARAGARGRAGPGVAGQAVRAMPVGVGFPGQLRRGHLVANYHGPSRALKNDTEHGPKKVSFLFLL